MLTKKDYCDYETCVALKELGFKQLVDWYFNEGKNIVATHARYRNTFVPRITIHEAQKFLREKKNLNVNIRAFIKDGWYYTIQYCDGNPLISQLTLTDELYKTYEEAFLEGIKEAVKILKEK